MANNEATKEATTLIEGQRLLVRSVKNALRNFKKDAAHRKTVAYFETRLDNLSSLRNEFRANHQKLVSHTNLENVQKQYIEGEVTDEFEEAYIDATSVIREDFEKSYPKTKPTGLGVACSSTPNVQSGSLHNDSSNDVPLPEIKLPTFNGNHVEWPAFKEIFVSRVHESQRLNDLQRFHYLKGALSNEAAKDIEHITLIGENYQIAWKMLVETYDNKRILFAHYMNVLDQTPMVPKDDVLALKRFTQTCRSCISSIGKLGVKINDQSEVLVYYLTKKLPYKVRNEFDHATCKQRTVPTFEDLCKVLDEQYQMMISSSRSNEGTVSKTSTSEKSDYRQKRDVNSVQVSKQSQCEFCKNGIHSVRECKEFLKLDIVDRKAAVIQLQLCFNCLGYNHRASACSSQRTCLYCGGKHHTLIHNQTEQPVDSKSEIVSANMTSTGWSTSPMLNMSVLLPTAVVSVRNKDGGMVRLRVFLDQGSEASFITTRAVHQLALTRQKAEVTINGLAVAQIGVARSSVQLTFSPHFDESAQHHVKAYIIPKINNAMPEQSFDIAAYEHLRDLQLADPKFNESRQVHMLLGCDIYDEIVLGQVRKGHIDMPIAQKTTLGFIVYGKRLGSSVKSWNATIRIENIITKFWELEDLPSDSQVSAKNVWAEEFYKKNHIRSQTGKYTVRLPLLSHIDASKVIGSSRAIALRRFLQLERRLDQNSELKQAYRDTIEEYLQLGQMKPTTTTEQEHKKLVNGIEHYTCCYIPHHAVIKESSSTTKMRVVFDASAKTSNGKALNDILAIGPVLQTNLIAVLTKWRFAKIAFIADIEKMYRRINLNERDAQYQRIFWRNNSSDEIQEFYCSTVMFGTASAPYTAIRTMQQLADDEAKRFPKAAYIIKHQMYVDDVLSGSDSVEEACELQRQLVAAMKTGTFELRKWCSNHEKLFASIPLENRETKELSSINADSAIKALGIFWNPKDDLFQYKINFELNVTKLTKRTIVSMAARLFDPLGWLNPIIITAKLIIQQLWLEKFGWDVPVSTDIEKAWIEFIKELKNILNIRIPRWLHSYETSTTHEFHLFCDASNKAYSVAAYLRVPQECEKYKVHLIAAKCKVSPIKPKLTIPRAELCGAVLGVKFLKFLKTNLNDKINAKNVFLWTDSTIVLSWIKGASDDWEVFVGNRLQKIWDSTNANQWRHVRSEDNPADLSTRGVKVSLLLDKDLWWHGPSWLSEHSSCWPKAQANASVPLACDLQERKPIQSNHLNIEPVEILHLLSKFSSLSRLIRVLAFMLRFVANCKERIRKGPLQAAELQTSVQKLVGVVQREVFAPESKLLAQGLPVQSNSRLASLNPVWDTEEKLIRVGGRLQNSILSKDQKHPYILPEKHIFTKLVIDFSHKNTLHGGLALTLNHIRKRFWIINGRNAVRSALHYCVICYKCKPNSSSQLMGNLPAVRVQPIRTFSATGVDYAGPLGILPSKGRGRKSVKGYIAIFICLATKAVHIEPVGDLSSNTFLGALYRFISRRGICKDIYSDCGTNFVGANRKLQEDKVAYKAYINSNIAPYLTEIGITWHFNPPSAPHFGGIWEAGVKSMKYHLRRCISDRKLSFEELSTVLTQIESCLNSRPLCPLSNDPDDLMVLTPGHFLINDALLAPPIPDLGPVKLTDRWRNCQILAQLFWKQWSKEYLARLQERPKWCRAQPNFKVNDVVLVKGEHLPSNRWPLGRIVAVHPGDDNIVRVVTLKTAEGTLKRPIVKLCLLPTQESWSQCQSRASD